MFFQIRTKMPKLLLSVDVGVVVQCNVLSMYPWLNRPLLSSKNPHFQIEAKCTTFLVKMSFMCMRMKNHFHIKGWALNLVLIQWPQEPEMAYSSFSFFGLYSLLPLFLFQRKAHQYTLVNTCICSSQGAWLVVLRCIIIIIFASS